MEEWRPIPEWDGYLVSSDGRVRGSSGRVLKPWMSADGYSVVTLSRRVRSRQGEVLNPAGPTRTRKHLGVSRAVLTAFRGPQAGMDAAHINGDKQDNRLSNLTWATRLENIGHQVLHGTRLRGETANPAKLTEAVVRVIRQRCAAGESQCRVAEEFGVTQGNVSQIVRRKTWRHVA